MSRAVIRLHRGELCEHGRDGRVWRTRRGSGSVHVRPWLCFVLRFLLYRPLSCLSCLSCLEGVRLVALVLGFHLVSLAYRVSIPSTHPLSHTYRFLSVY